MMLCICFEYHAGSSRLFGVGIVTQSIYDWVADSIAGPARLHCAKARGDVARFLHSSDIWLCFAKVLLCGVKDWAEILQIYLWFSLCMCVCVCVCVYRSLTRIIRQSSWKWDVFD